MSNVMFSWLKTKEKTKNGYSEEKLRNLLLHDELSFIMSVATDENRGRDNPKDLQEIALSMILSKDDDIAFFAIDACAVRMHLAESFPLILERLPQETSAYVLSSMCSGVSILGKRELVSKQVAIDTLRDIRIKLSGKGDNENEHRCSEYLEEMQILEKKSGKDYSAS